MTTRCRSSSRQRGTNRMPALRHPGHVRALAIGQTEFAWKLYKACRAQLKNQPSSDETGNLHFSPLVIHHALTMVYAGSRYESAELLRTALCLSAIEGDAAVNLAYGDVTRALAAVTAAAAAAAVLNDDQEPTKPTLELHLATRLYVPLTHCGLLDQYVTSLRVHYGSDVAKVPFHTDRERACREINQWVEESTEQNVKDLVRTPHGLPTFVSLVLPSAVYFRAAWDKRLADGKAELAPFHNGPDDIVHVMTLKARGNFRHGFVESAGCRMAEVPFADERYSLVLILPVDVDKGLEEIEAKLSADILVHLEEHLDKRSKVKITLPRFRVDDATSLAKVLIDDIIGIGPVFARGKVNLSGISGNNNLHLSHVEHKVCFEMDHIRRTKVPKKQVVTEPKKQVVTEPKKDKIKKEDKKKNKEVPQSPAAPPSQQVNDVQPAVDSVTSTNGQPPPVSANGDQANEADETKLSKTKKAKKTKKTKPKAEKKDEGTTVPDQSTKETIVAEVKEKPKKETKEKPKKEVKLEKPKQEVKEMSKQEARLEKPKPKPSQKSNRHIEFNRPFIYVVRDRHLSMLLLMGCVRKLSQPSTTPIVVGVTAL